MLDARLPENKYLNPYSFVSEHVASVVRKSIAGIRPSVPKHGHAGVEETYLMIDERRAFCQ